MEVVSPPCTRLCFPRVGPTRLLGRTSAPIRAESSFLQQKQMLERKEEHCLFMAPWGGGEEDSMRRIKGSHSFLPPSV